jgi:hypothetical protein
MYALPQNVQFPYPRVLTLACPGFLTVADIKGNVGATLGLLICIPGPFTITITNPVDENALPAYSGPSSSRRNGVCFSASFI